jgi:hypothetical protein
MILLVIATEGSLRGMRGEDDPPRLARLAVRPGRDLHVLVKGGQHAHQFRLGISPELAAMDLGQIALADADQLRCRLLGERTLLDQAVELDDDGGFKPHVRGVGEPQVSKNVAAADFDFPPARGHGLRPPSLRAR